MKPSEVITEVRWLIQDTKAPYRYSDTMLLGFVNQALKRMVMLRPDLFAVVADFDTTAGTVLQSCPADSVRLINIFQVKGGNAITEVNRQILDCTVPNWQNEEAGQPINFMRHVHNPNKFFVYPRPVAGVVLVGEYVQMPPNYTLNAEIINLPNAYFPVVVDGTVFLAESIDNEHVHSGRAKLFHDAFMQGLGISLQSRVVTDTPSAGLNPKEVV
jgi:hypothetical protein